MTNPRGSDVVVGNYHHKYTSTNPAIRWLTNRFMGRLDDMFTRLADANPHARVVEVGCGEGEVTKRLSKRWSPVVAIDLPAPELRVDWAHLPGPTWLHADAEQLPFADNTFDIGVGIEVLEHLDNPNQGLAELVRVCSSHLVLSVPREPIFRLGNLAALRHVRALGNTPGHFHHWSSGSFVRFLEQVGRVRVIDKPLPWTICLVDLP
jgi:ubiquinone/menaquinone biosynthesis C-methylase UbiE